MVHMVQNPECDAASIPVSSYPADMAEPAIRSASVQAHSAQLLAQVPKVTGGERINH